MNTIQTFRRGAMMLLAGFLISGLAIGQNLVVSNSSTFSGNGTINVGGNITTPSLTLDKTIDGTVNLTGTNQSIGTAATAQTLTFRNLNANNSGTKTQEVSGIVVDSSLTVANTVTVDIQGFTLSIDKVSTLTGSGTINVSDATSTVNFTRSDGTPQTVLGLDYAGDLNLTGAGSEKDLSAAGSANDMTHSGGDLTVNFDWSIGTSGTFTTIADVAGALSFDAGATGTKSIATVTDVSTGSITSNATAGVLGITTLSGNSGNVNATGVGGVSITTATNGNGTITADGGDVTVGTLSGNSGTIRTIGGGVLAFTSDATNAGAITGAAGTGGISFGGALANNGTAVVTAGSGNVSFAGLVSNAAGAQIVGGADSLDFDGNVDNSGTISLAAAGRASFAGNFVNNVGTLTLNAASFWTYDGASQDIAGGGLVTYGNLATAGSGTKTALGNVSVTSAFDNGGATDLAIVTDMDIYALTAASLENTNSTLEFGGETNGFAPGVTTAAAGTVIYNGHSGDAVPPASQTIAAGSYFQLQFAGDAPKDMVTNTTVTTGSGVALNAGVTMNVVQTAGTTTLTINNGGLTLAATSAMVNDGTVNVTGDLDNAGALTNNGTITVQ